MPTNKLYNEPDGDLVVVSSDGVEARVRAHKFKAISDLACGLVDDADDPSRIVLDETADNVGLLLRFSLDPQYVGSREVDLEASLRCVPPRALPEPKRRLVCRPR